MILFILTFWIRIVQDLHPQNLLFRIARHSLRGIVLSVNKS